MRRDIGGIVLDMDGLMLDTEPLYKVAWQAASAELGYVLDDQSYDARDVVAGLVANARSAR